MTKQTRILLAGTILPALVLSPMTPAAAQAPDQAERHSPHRDGGEKAQHGEPGMRGDGGRPTPGDHAGHSERRQERDGGSATGRQNDQRQNAQGNVPGPKANRGDAAADDMARGRKQRPGDNPQRAAQPDRTPQPDRAQTQDDPARTNTKARRDDGPGAPRRIDNDAGNDRRGAPVGVGVGVAVGAGLAGGFIAPTGARRIDDLRRDRREVREGDRTFIREPGRTIVQEQGRAFIVHDENDRFRDLGFDVHRGRRGNAFVDTFDRPGGEQILTFTDASGRLLRRVRRLRDGREIVLIDNGEPGDYAADIVVLPPPPMRIPRDRYVVDYAAANVGLLYDTLVAPPLVAPPRRYTLDQIRYSPDVRGYLRSIDINTISFDSGSWDVPASATGLLQALGTAIKQAVDRNPSSVFLVEGYTDATGNPDDNLSLSDRRAQSVAEILTKDFAVPPENLTTQGYGQQNPKEDTAGPSAANRRVVVRNITPLLATGGPAPAGQ